MKTTPSIYLDSPSRISAALGLLAVYNRVDILLPSGSWADLILLNQLTLAMHQNGFPPAVVYDEPPYWRVRGRSSVVRSAIRKVSLDIGIEK